MPNLNDGTFASSQKLAFKRLADYIADAESGNLKKVLAALDRNTRDPDCHPNAVLLCAIVMLGHMRAATGRSAVPAARRAAEQWDRLTPGGIWRS